MVLTEPGQGGRAQALKNKEPMIEDMGVSSADVRVTADGRSPLYSGSGNSSEGDASVATDEWTQRYWQQQYESVRHHEAQRLTVSNITMSLTLVVLALAFNQGDFNVANGLALPLAVVAANASAVAKLGTSSVNRDR